MNRKDVLRQLATFGSSQTAAVVATFLTSIMTRRILGPDAHGQWLTASFVLVIGTAARLGIINGLSRELPLERGRGNEDRIAALRSVSLRALFGWPLLLSLLIAASGFVLNALQWTPAPIGYGIVFCGLLLPPSFVLAYIEVVFKAYDRFEQLGRILLARAIVQSLVTVGFAYAFGYYGMYLSIAVSTAYGIYLGRDALERVQQSPMQADYKFTLRQLIVSGLPILATGLLWQLMYTIDRMIVSQLFSSEDVGYYGLGILAYTAVLQIPLIVNQVLYPKFLLRYGANDSIAEQSRFMHVKLLILTPILCLCAGCLYWSLEPFVKYVLPQFAPGLKLAKLLVIGIIPLALVSSLNVFYAILGHQKTALIILVGCLTANVGISFGLGIAIGTPMGVAIGSVLAYFLYFLISLDRLSYAFGTSLSKRAAETFVLLFFGSLILGPVVIADGSNSLWSLLWLVVCAGATLVFAFHQYQKPIFPQASH